MFAIFTCIQSLTYWTDVFSQRDMDRVERDTCKSFLITLSRPSLTSRLKIVNRSLYHSAPVLWNNLPSHLRQVVHRVTPSLISNSPVSNLLTSLFLKKLKPIYFTLPVLLSLYSPMLFSGSIFPVLTKLRLFIPHTFRYRSPSYRSRQFLCYLTCKCLRICGH